MLCNKNSPIINKVELGFEQISLAPKQIFEKEELLEIKSEKTIDIKNNTLFGKNSIISYNNVHKQPNRYNKEYSLFGKNSIISNLNTKIV